MANAYILLWLEGSLQSWGHDSRFWQRDTLEFPTKSGVMGLVCCALGAGGEQCELLAEFAPLDLQVAAYEKEKVSQSVMTDFHMVGSAYDDKDPWQSLLIPRTNEGKKAVGGGAKLTYRSYLQDATFAVALEVPAGMADKVAEALQNPVWDLYLGRKSCAPTEFIYQGIYTSAEAALAGAEDFAKAKGKHRTKIILQGEHDGEVISLTDVPLRFGPAKLYGDRKVTILHEDYVEPLKS